MDSGIVLKVLGLLLIIEAIAMVPAIGVSMYYGEGDLSAFLISTVLTALFGVVSYALTPKRGFVRYREGFMIVGLGWILVSLFGTLPFVFYGTFDSFIDAFFEVVSGFTTTGATVLADIESQPHGILFWRSLTHWLGGMGILVLTLAILPAMGMGSFQIFKSESTGPMPGKLVSKVGKTARILYIIYFVFSLLEIVALKLAGMSLFDSFTHTFATMGTGGFSTKNASVGAFSNPSADWIITGFMLLASVNFALYYEMIVGDIRALFRDGEAKLFLTITLLSVGLIALDVGGLYDSMAETLRYAFFQVASIISTTGFATYDYEQWPELSKAILYLLMFIGGCAGSTGGGIKNIRLLIVLKYIRRTLYRLIHPQAVIPVRIGGRPIAEETIHNVVGFILVYALIFVAFSLILLTQGMDLVSSTSAVVAALSNIGPGFGLVGPATTYAGLTDLTKGLLSIAMILGRLEIYTILVMLVPAFWKQ